MINVKIECLGKNAKCGATSSKIFIKVSVYDGKLSWHVYKIQFAIIAESNCWDSISKIYHLAATLRGEAANISETLSQEQTLEQTLMNYSNALELRFGESALNIIFPCSLSTTTRKRVKAYQNTKRT